LCRGAGGDVRDRGDASAERDLSEPFCAPESALSARFMVPGVSQARSLVLMSPQEDEPAVCGCQELALVATVAGDRIKTRAYIACRSSPSQG
jgi:hypothetical protein